MAAAARLHAACWPLRWLLLHPEMAARLLLMSAPRRQSSHPLGQLSSACAASAVAGMLQQHRLHALQSLLLGNPAPGAQQALLLQPGLRTPATLPSRRRCQRMRRRCCLPRRLIARASPLACGAAAAGPGSAAGWHHAEVAPLVAQLRTLPPPGVAWQAGPPASFCVMLPAAARLPVLPRLPHCSRQPVGVHFPPECPPPPAWKFVSVSIVTWIRPAVLCEGAARVIHDDHECTPLPEQRASSDPPRHHPSGRWRSLAETPKAAPLHAPAPHANDAGTCACRSSTTAFIMSMHHMCAAVQAAPS